MAHFLRTSLETKNGLQDQVLAELVTSYVIYSSQLEQQFVLRKVCSTLAAFYLYPNSGWQSPVRHVLTSLCAGQFVPPEQVDDSQKVWTQIQYINAPQLRSSLWLGSALVEELTRQDLKATERSGQASTHSFTNS